MKAFRFEVDDVPEQDLKIIRQFRDFLDELKKQPFTNADRIRAMSDEELQDFLFNKVSVDSICNFCVPKMRTERKCDGHCKNGILEWLKQPAEGE